MDRRRCLGLRQPPFSGDTLWNCSRGFQQELYSQVTGRPVEVTVERALLRGDDHCEFTIRIGPGIAAAGMGTDERPRE